MNYKTGLPTIQSIREANPGVEYNSIQFANLAESRREANAKSELNYNLLGLNTEKLSGDSLEKQIEKHFLYFFKEQ
ncbi:MAG: CubicO group peptidase (beta-lactamase class C family) [Arenicella sp.]|jgi:CubicO group peptidase (beta-lactamase class C family)